MKAYPDTSYLCALYRFQENSERAASHFAAMPGSLVIASPLLFEFRQSIRLQAWLHTKDRGKGYDKQTALHALAKFQNNISTGAIKVIPVEWADVAGIAETISSEFTWTSGCRGFDILHVATALHLGSSEFLTFDRNQKKLALAKGLTVPF
ncbi:MAG: type II toxin-antitoxin system VapC family toxin [Akkermansiaceae bacterium]|nr:type II toxin-antitoxin system VapC family toxin [Akkermansiaceae bacterium]